MTNENSLRRGRLFWRWALIAAELLVIIFLVFVEMLGGRENAFTHSTPIRMFGLLSGVSMLFLIFGAPLLIPSQKFLAVTGWIIGVAGFLIPLLFY